MVKLSLNILNLFIGFLICKTSALSIRGGEVAERNETILPSLRNQSIKRTEIHSPDEISLDAWNGDFRDILVENGISGDWGSMVMCPDNFHVCGLKAQWKYNVGGWDDTAMNGLAVRCCSIEYHLARVDKFIGIGPFGKWYDMVLCPNIDKGWRLTGVSTRFEEYQGSGDDTALNGIKMMCETKPDGSLVLGGLKMVEEGDWGTWGPLKGCPYSHPFVCGFKARIEPDQGTNEDDTGMNGLVMRCCSL